MFENMRPREKGGDAERNTAPQHDFSIEKYNEIDDETAGDAELRRAMEREIEALRAIPIEELTNEKIDEFNLPKIVIATLLTSWGGGMFVLQHPTLFENSDHPVLVKKLFEEGSGEVVAQNIHKFPKKSLDYHALEKLAEGGHLSIALKFEYVFNCEPKEIEKLKQKHL